MDKAKEIKVIPVNGQVLIKKVIKDFPVLAITTGRIPNEIGEVEYLIEESSVHDYKKGDRVLIDDNIIKQGIVQKVYDIPNESDFLKVSNMIKGLGNKEKQDLIKDKTTFDIIEYLLIHNGSIVAIIE